MTHYNLVQTFSAVVFRHLPRTTSRQAQEAHKLAKAIAVDVVEEWERIQRVETVK